MKKEIYTCRELLEIAYGEQLEILAKLELSTYVDNKRGIVKHSKELEKQMIIINFLGKYNNY